MTKHSSSRSRQRAGDARTATFFVSYASADERWARWIVWELQNTSARYRCISQFKDFPPGTRFLQRMRVAAEAPATIALFSPHYFRSVYCGRELDAALAGERETLLPVRIAECDPGRYLASKIYIDVVGKSVRDARVALINGVEAFLARVEDDAADATLFRARPTFPGAEQTVHSPQYAPSQNGRAAISVLFLGPNVGGLKPREQLRQITRAVSAARYPLALRFKGVFDVHASTLFEQLNKQAPDVFHFSGKQNGGDVLMRTRGGGLTRVSDRALAGMFSALDAGLRLVIIDTCASLRAAATIAKVVPCAIGVEGDIYEDDATLYYQRLYQALASGRSVRDAASQARSALQLKGVDKTQIPQLCCRADTRPAEIFFSGPRAR